MSSGATRSAWVLRLPLLVCLTIMGCRFIGCGERIDTEDGGPTGAPGVGRLSVPTAGASGVIRVPEAAEPDQSDDGDEDTPGVFTFDADAEPQSGGAPLDVEFTLTMETPPPGLTIHWSFGDGSPPVNIKNPVHMYRTPGEYTAVLTITGPDIDETREFDIEVTEEAFDVDIEADPDIGPAPLTSHFTAVVPDEIENDVTCEWTFGDGARATGKTTEHTYSQPGTYTATLVVRQTNGQQGTKEVEIQVDEPDESAPDSSDSSD